MNTFKTCAGTGLIGFGGLVSVYGFRLVRNSRKSGDLGSAVANGVTMAAGSILMGLGGTILFAGGLLVIPS